MLRFHLAGIQMSSVRFVDQNRIVLIWDYVEYVGRIRWPLSVSTLVETRTMQLYFGCFNNENEALFSRSLSQNNNTSQCKARLENIIL